MKQDHDGIGDNIFAGGNIYISDTIKNTSSLSDIINILGKQLHIPPITESEKLIDFSIDHKITFNNIVRFRPILDEYRIFAGKLSVIYTQYDEQGSDVPFKVLSFIRICYLKERGKYLSGKSDGEEVIDTIRKNADNIIEDIENILTEEISKSNNINESIESMKICVQIILIDALMKCKILEEPILNAII